MPIRRKRKANAPVKKGIDVSKLGAPFEWTDERLKVALESWPSPKRLLGKAELNMCLSLGLYFDDITETWKPLSAIDISTVRNQGRFYLSPPADLTVDEWTAMRIDEKQRLITNDVAALEAFNDIRRDAVLVGISQDIYDAPVTDFAYDGLTIFLEDNVVLNASIDVFAFTPHGIQNIYTNLVVAGTNYKSFVSFIPWAQLRVVISQNAAQTLDFSYTLTKRRGAKLIA